VLIIAKVAIDQRLPSGQTGTGFGYVPGCQSGFAVVVGGAPLSG
jgi:hypothetical protein